MNWDTLKPSELDNYCNVTDANLDQLEIDPETHLCADLMCKKQEHNTNTRNLYEGAVNALIKGSESVFGAKSKNNFNMPGWNDYVADLYDSSREARSLWLDQGKPNRGPIYELHVNTKRKVKYAINFIKKNEAKLRKESLAKKLSDCNIKEFWKEIRSLNNSNTPLTEVIDNVAGASNILKLWQDHYSNLFNILKKCKYDSNKYILQSSYQEILVTFEETL